MRITVYVCPDHLENLNKFLNHGHAPAFDVSNNPIDWVNSREKASFIKSRMAVSVTYENYVKLKDYYEEYV